MTPIRTFLLVSAAALGALAAAPTPAQAQFAAAQLTDQRPALAVIRFNQRKVYFEQSVYSALSKALQVKQDLMIDLVAFYPQTGDEDRDETWRNTSGQHTKQVADSLVGMGVPPERINISSEAATNLRFDEVHLFVR